VNDPTVRLVLDTSAVLAYADGSIDLGEVITEVVDEAQRFAVPAPCLIEASRLARDDQAAGTRLLVHHTHCVVLPLPADGWEPVAARARTLGRADLAACLVEAAALPPSPLPGKVPRWTSRPPSTAAPASDTGGGATA